jgi:hypothetical protein
MVITEQIPGSWCRMWSEDATLARELLGGDARQWSGVGERLDSVVGPAAMTEFVRTYQRNVGNTFAPRTLVIDGNERLAYTWDATRRDGTVVTGIDVCVLRDGVVTLNWTVPAGERSDLPDGPGIEVLSADARALDRAGLTAVASGLYPWHGDLVVDVERQTVGGVWSDGGVGGLAVIVVTDGAVARSWSLPGTRPLAY